MEKKKKPVDSPTLKEDFSIFEYLDKVRLRGNLRQVFLKKYEGEQKTEEEWNKIIK